MTVNLDQSSIKKKNEVAEASIVTNRTFFKGPQISKWALHAIMGSQETGLQKSGGVIMHGY